MTPTQFIHHWQTTYPEAFPISHELKHVYPDRWFRIHSFPQEKRYPDSEEDYRCLLHRQNQLIDDLIGQGTELAIVLGLYRNDITLDAYYELTDFAVFQKVWTLDLHQERPQKHQEGVYLDFFVKIEPWTRKEDILRAIANDAIRALFVCPSRKCIIAPYDGGVDTIVASTTLRDQLSIHYQGWLSPREDGL